MEKLLYRGVWPVLDRRPLHELIAEAEGDLPWMLALSRVERTVWGRLRWSIRPGRDVPGSGGAAEVLVVDMPVARVARTEATVTQDARRLAVAA